MICTINFIKYNLKEYNHYLQFVQPEERARIKRFYKFIDSKRALIGRLLLRQAIHTLLNVNWLNIELGRSPDNKPFIKQVIKLYLLI